MRLNRLVPFTELIAQCGHVPSVDPQAEAVRGAGDDEAEALGIDPGTACLVVERLLRAGGSPVIDVTDVVPLDRLAVAPADVAHADSTFAFLEAHGTDPVDYATTEFIPRTATTATPAGLELDAGTPYIELLETHFSREHERIAVSRIAVDDSLVRFSLLRREI